jgi:flagellar basal-body rod protein FlgC
MDFFSAMEITSSGLNVERTRLNLIASNLANARTTQTAEGGPYRRLDPVVQAVPLAQQFRQMANEPEAAVASTVRVTQIAQDSAPPQQVYDPTHPDADAAGFVSLPNVNVVEEMVNLITASRAYEAGVTVLQSIKGMASSALTIGG